MAATVVLFILGAGCLVCAVYALMGKGSPFRGRAARSERPYSRFIGLEFLFVALSCAFGGLFFLLRHAWLMSVMVICLVVALALAMVRGVRAILGE